MATRRLIATLTLALVCGMLWMNSDASRRVMAPPICKACVGPDNTECHHGLNFGYTGCGTYWYGGEQLCWEDGTNEQCEGLP